MPCLAPLAAFNVFDIAENIGANLISTGIVIALVWFRDGIFLRLRAAYRWAYSFVKRKRFVLVWVDDDDESVSRKLIDGLGDQGDSQLIFKPITRPRSLLFYPRSSKRTACIVLLDTDVSKLADQPKTAQLIDERMHAFVSDGGGLIGGHDLIYRRVRNKKLQMVFGCEINDFRRYDKGPVPYCLNPGQDDHPLALDLPERFELKDGEVCWGDWASDAETVFRSVAIDDDPPRPLVICRKYLKGRVVWLNSGDKGERLCESIATPEAEFVLLLRNALRWVTEAHE